MRLSHLFENNRMPAEMTGQDPEFFEARGGQA
jgi:hypothetical protein